MNQNTTKVTNNFSSVLFCLNGHFYAVLLKTITILTIAIIYENVFRNWKDFLLFTLYNIDKQ